LVILNILGQFLKLSLTLPELYVFESVKSTG